MIKEKEINIEKISSGSNEYIQLTMKNVEIEEYEIRMINENDGNGFLKVGKNIFNENTNLKYSTTGFVSLKEFVNAGDISKETLTQIFTNILVIVDNCIFLNRNKIALRENLIFVRTTDMSVELAYVPTKEEFSESIDCDFRKMICEMFGYILSECKAKQGSADFIMELKKICTEQELLISDIVSFCKSNINRNPSKGIEQKGMPKVNPVKSVNTKQNNNNSKVKGYPNLSDNNSKVKEYPELSSSSNSNNNNNNNSNSKGFSVQPKEASSKIAQEPEFEEVEKYKTINLIGAIIIQPIILGMIIAMFLFMDVEIVQKVGGSIMLVALDILIIRQFLDPKKKIKVKKRVDIKTSNGKISKENIKEPKVIKEPIVSNQIVFDDRNNAFSSDEEDTTYSADEEDTTYSGDYSDMPRVCATIEYNNGRETGIVELKNTECYTIGRNSNLSKYILGTDVSRKHLEIFFENEVAYVKDLNSTNGTKVNGDKVSSNEKYELSNGDYIEIPDFTIIFKYN